ncbi:MAG: PIN domain-containing protein [Bacteroidetes bacterium]|nr:PIN domain-containing protein [Bacteroidota bacterium]
MCMRIYIDTSVIGGYFDEEFEESSKKLFDEFKAGKKTMIISDVTLKELEDAPVRVRSLLDTVSDKHKEIVLLDDEARELANHYLKEKIVTEKSLADTRHIAIASVNRADVLVSWNFKHIVNYKLIRLYNSVNLKFGYPMLEIRTPQETVEP